MTTSSLRGTQWAGLAANIALTVLTIAVGSYGQASFQVVCVLAIAGLLWGQPRIDALLDARLGEAQAKRRIADLALHAFEQQMREGNVRVTVTPTTDMRVN